MTLAVATFLFCAFLLIVAGSRLAYDGDTVADRTGIGGVWIGALLLAMATSLPELVADVTAGIHGFADLAVGDVIGSGLANMLILAVVDIVFIIRFRKTSLFKKTTGGHAELAILAITLTAMAALFIQLAGLAPALGWQIGLGPAVIAVVYVGGVWLNFRTRRKVDDLPVAPPGRPLAPALIGILVSTVVIIGAAPFMVDAAQYIAVRTGLGATFFGTMFLAAVTSFPELVVSLSALRLGAFDMVVGNLFGSNAFNMFVIFFVDVAYRKGPLLAAVSRVHIISALFLMLMMGIGLVAALTRGRQRSALLLPDSLLLIGAYAIGMYTIYALS